MSIALVKVAILSSISIDRPCYEESLEVQLLPRNTALFPTLAYSALVVFAVKTALFSNRAIKSRQ
jgi:hypothetical protein